MKELLHETDWLASTPHFYNENSGRHSQNINHVVDWSSFSGFHPEGLYNFLDFGFSVFEQTPLRDVRFMRHSSRLGKHADGTIEVEYVPDPVEGYLDYRLSEDDIIDLIRTRVQTWEDSLPSDQEIVLPLSGGYDSRLLLWCIKNKERVRAYTYGISEDQRRSKEVVHAKALAERFGVRWKQIELGNFHEYFEDWNNHFGLSTHAHGMYHFEFYSKIREELAGQKAFLSGIFGDVWAGSVPYTQLGDPKNINKIGYTHGMRADPSRLIFDPDHDIRERFWRSNINHISDERLQIVTIIRIKIMLISYLIRVPQIFGFLPWTPYLDIDVAMAMINLPPQRRKNRVWQKDFFSKVGLDLESERLSSARGNSLDLQGIRNIPPRPLDQSLLSSLIDPAYVAWINRNIGMTLLGDMHRKILSIPKIGGALRRLHLDDPTLKAYFAYLCLRPVEATQKAIHKR